MSEPVYELWKRVGKRVQDHILIRAWYDIKLEIPTGHYVRKEKLTKKRKNCSTLYCLKYSDWVDSENTTVRSTSQ